MDNVDIYFYNDEIYRLYKSCCTLSYFYDLYSVSDQKDKLDLFLKSHNVKSIDPLFKKIKSTSTNINVTVTNKCLELIRSIDTNIPLISRDYREKISDIKDTNIGFLHFALKRLDISFKLFAIIKSLSLNKEYSDLLRFKIALFKRFKELDIKHTGISIDNNKLVYTYPKEITVDTDIDIERSIDFIGGKVEYLFRSSKKTINKLLESISKQQEEIKTTDTVYENNNNVLIVNYVSNTLIYTIIKNVLNTYKYLIEHGE